MPDSRTLLQTALREPTLHFFLIAALIFLFYALGQSRAQNTLEINQSDIDTQLFLQELSSGQALSEEQRQYVTSRYIEDQILVREALDRNLDDDARIHDILAQKMRHILSGEIIQPTAEELETYYSANAERYRTFETITNDELVFNTREDLPDSIHKLLREGAEPEVMLALSPGNVAPLANVNPVDLANIFSDEFADSVLGASTGEWTGPFVSNRGQHWLRITDRKAASVPALEDIADRVRLDWIAEEEEARLQQQIDALWLRYRIVITDDTGEN